MIDKSCVKLNDSLSCPPGSTWSRCRPWDLESDTVNCYASTIVDESLALGGVTINVHKLLGIHEQVRTTDELGIGTPITNSNTISYPVNNAFTKIKSSWRSNPKDILSKIYIGYDFGEVKLQNGRVRYGIEANVRKEIRTIQIKQSVNQAYRVNSVRIERSEDGKVWYGVQVAKLPNSDELHTIVLTNTVPSRYWRIRPIHYDHDCGFWELQALSFSESDHTNLTTIQDKIWLENRSREYMQTPIAIKGMYTPPSTSMDLSRYGIAVSGMDNFQISVSISQCIAALNRPIIVGDILELPAETMITQQLTTQKLFLEVNSVSWETSGTITPGWQHTMLSIMASPALASEETQDIFGDKVPQIDESGLSDIFNGTSDKYQDYADITQTIFADSNTQVPERGQDVSGALRQFDYEVLNSIPTGQVRDRVKLALDTNKRSTLYNQDGMPPNGLPYTEGPEFPPNPQDKDYHRLTYEGTASGISIRLYRWSLAKAKWIYLETDRRVELNNQTNLLTEYTGGTVVMSSDQFGK